MIKLNATAVIYYISPVIEIPSKTGGQGFLKRELILDDSRVKDGTPYPNYVAIEFTGERMNQLDNFAPGQRVTVEAFVTGRESQGRFFTSLKGLSVTLFQQQQAVSSAPIQQPQYPQQPAYPQQQISRQPSYPQPGYPQPPMSSLQGANLGPDGLPFR